MKRVIVVLVGLLAALAFAGVAYASASLSLLVNNGTSATVPQGGALTFSGSLAGTTYLTGHTITVYEYTDSKCTTGQKYIGEGSTSAGSGAYSVAYTVASDALIGKHYYKAKHVADNHVGDLSTDCLTVTVTAKAAAAFVPAIPNVFLCYSAFQTDPGVWPATEAAALIKAGYWSPYAVPNTVTGGTNVGGYHLVCNLATGQSAGTSVLGGAGEVYGAGATADVTNVPGHYTVVGP